MMDVQLSGYIIRFLAEPRHNLVQQDLSKFETQIIKSTRFVKVKNSIIKSKDYVKF